VLELDSGERIAQSSAILWYLAERTPLLPATALDRARVAQWLAFEQERVMGGLGNPRFRLLTGRAEPGDPAIEARLETGRGALDVLDGHLAGREYVVGDSVTIADLGLFPYVSVAGDAGVDLAAYPQVSSWLERVRALPGFADDYVRYPKNARPGAGRSIYAH
jgi:glutathione S-transferase